MPSVFAHSMRRAGGALVVCVAASCFSSSHPHASPILASDSHAPIVVDYFDTRPPVVADLPAGSGITAPAGIIRDAGSARVRDISSGQALSSPFSIVQPATPQVANNSRQEQATLSPDALRNVLRSIATVHRTDAASPVYYGVRRARGSEHPAPFEYNQTAYLNLFDLILDSELAGSALRALVDVKSTDDDFKIFSVLGLGEFVLETETNAHSAVFYELSSGWTATLGGGRNGSGLLGYSADLARAGGYPPGAGEKINYLQLAWNWLIDALTSPIGVLFTMVCIMSIFLWSATKVIGHLQRRETAPRRR